jgi:hypothetical protein
METMTKSQLRRLIVGMLKHGISFKIKTVDGASRAFWNGPPYPMAAEWFAIENNTVEAASIMKELNRRRPR